MDLSYFKDHSNIKHNNKYDYGHVEFVNRDVKVYITCPRHGDFLQTPKAHLIGQGCPECKRDKLKSHNTKYTTDIIREIGLQKHGDRYDYSETVYVDYKTPIKVKCKVHGYFYPSIDGHIRGGYGCPVCAKDRMIVGSTKHTKEINDSVREDIITRFESVHGDRYDYSQVNYIDMRTKINIGCKIHGMFEQLPGNHLFGGNGCPHCKSKSEHSLYEYITSLYTGVIERGNRTVLGGLELDIYLPEKKLAFEFNGLKWHSTEFNKDKNYHLNKTLKCEQQGIHLIHIFEDDWLNKCDIVKSRISNIFGKSITIGARKCTIKDIDSKTTRMFLDENHIQGFVGSNVRLGLFYDDDLVSIMTFGGLRYNLGQKPEIGCYELLRFCNKCGVTVTGGADKLFKHFLKTYNPISVISYSDRSWTMNDSNSMYNKLNFVVSSISRPNYYYVDHGKRINRFTYRKSELIKMGYDPLLSETEITESMGLYRIYDSGSIKYTYTKILDS